MEFWYTVNVIGFQTGFLINDQLYQSGLILRIQFSSKFVQS